MNTYDMQMTHYYIFPVIKLNFHYTQRRVNLNFNNKINTTKLKVFLCGKPKAPLRDIKMNDGIIYYDEL